MKVRVAFTFSQAEKELGLRFLRWKWRLPLDEFNFNTLEEAFKEVYKDVLYKQEDKQPLNDKQTEKDKRSKDGVPKFLLKAILYPKTRTRIWKFIKKLTYRVYNLFSMRFEDIEVRGGTLGDPFYDAMVLGLSRGCYYPDWENENKNWSAEGYLVLRTGFLRGFLFFTSLIYQTTALAFTLWRGLRRAKRAVQ